MDSFQNFKLAYLKKLIKKFHKTQQINLQTHVNNNNVYIMSLL